MISRLSHSELAFRSEVMQPTGCDNIVDHQNRLPFFHSITLHLEVVLPIFLFKTGLHHRTREFSTLSHWRERRSQFQCQTRTEQKAPRVQPHYNIWSNAIVRGEDL